LGYDRLVIRHSGFVMVWSFWFRDSSFFAQGLPLRRSRLRITIRQFFAMAQGRATPEERTYTV
jgi:hypothetical protein